MPDGSNCRMSYQRLQQDINKVDFVPVCQGKCKNQGFFPFLNISDINLERYGIYKFIDHPEINESCLYHANKSIKLDILKSFITSRLVPQTQLKEVADLLKICISCKIVYEESDETSTSTYSEEYKSDRSIKLLVYNNNMINDKVDVSVFYIKNYEKNNLDQRFVNHQRKKMLKKAKDKRYEFCKECKGIRSIIKLIIEQKLLVPINVDQLCSPRWSFKRSKLLLEGMDRPIYVKDKKDKNNIKQTMHFFGYKLNENEISDRLNELKEVIDSLNLRNHINVKLYYKFSELIQIKLTWVV